MSLFTEQMSKKNVDLAKAEYGFTRGNCVGDPIIFVKAGNLIKIVNL